MAASVRDTRRIGRAVIETEADALRTLAASLDEQFDAAVEAMLLVRGRVIVCGMGKSGHVARKIAATLASTGTPAQFVHAGEASHGDLGMVTGQDVVLAMSFSGETAELADIIAHTRLHGITLIGISGKSASTLMDRADIRLVLPAAKEAALEGLAPTTSTTMTMALGDALAAVLLERRGFTAEDFRVFHPGGSLGARLTQVGEIITDGDLRRNMAGLMEMTAEDVMTPNPRTVEPKMRAMEALAEMNDRKITTLIVCDEAKKPLGILHVHDCLRAGIS